MKKKIPLVIELIILLLVLIITSILTSLGNIPIYGLLIVALILYLANCLIIIHIFLIERNFETKISWIVFIILLPIIGHITFIFLGFNNQQTISKNDYKKALDEFANHEIDFISYETDDLFFNKIAKTAKREWRPASFVLEKHPFNSFDKLFEDLKNAKSFIHIEMYIIKPSEIYDSFKKLLAEKVAQGIEVRMIIDDFGNWKFDALEIQQLNQLGIKTYIFNKINFPFINIKQSFRLHRKMIIIDGKIIHTGGVNISDEYYCYDKKYGYWADINARVTGEICNDFSQLFLYDWYKISKEKLSPIIYLNSQDNININAYTLLLDESPDTTEYLLEQSLIDCLNFSRNKIRIATPYFVPSKKVQDLFKVLLLQGIEVEIFIPGLADKKYVLEATHFYLKELILSGAKVYQLENIFLHSKIATFDERFGYLGTVNWDMRTLFSNYESINFLQGDIVHELNDIFDDYLKISKPYIPPKINKLNLLYKFKVFFIKAFAPIM